MLRSPYLSLDPVSPLVSALSRVLTNTYRSSTPIPNIFNVYSEHVTKYFNLKFDISGSQGRHTVFGSFKETVSRDFWLKTFDLGPI